MALTTTQATAQSRFLRATRAFRLQLTLPTLALIDGNRCPVMSIRAEAIVKGDDKVPAISAASILAKVTRDRLMRAAAQAEAKPDAAAKPARNSSLVSRLNAPALPASSREGSGSLPGGGGSGGFDPADAVTVQVALGGRSKAAR